MTAAAKLAEEPEVERAVRKTVRGLLEQAPGWRVASPELRSALARKMAHVSLAAAALIEDDRRLAAKTESTAPAPAPLAEAQIERPSRRAARRPDPLAGFAAPGAAGAAVRSLRTALDFPTYVTELITGVFRAITTSSLQQMQALSDLLDNVSASVDTFAQRNVPPAEASRWASERFPFLTRGEGGGLRMREGADSNEAARLLREELGAPRSVLDGDDVGEALMPFIQRRMGRDRQAILGTIIQLGIQRVVVDEGRLHASMDMRVDARSLQERAQQNQTGVNFQTAASGNFSMGMWGASASMGLSVTNVHADSEYRKEELTAQAGMRSSVDLAFRTEQVPLDRLAGNAQRARLDAVARVPADVSQGSALTQGRITPPASMAPPERATVPQAPQPPGQTPPAGGTATTGGNEAGSHPSAGNTASNSGSGNGATNASGPANSQLSGGDTPE